MAVHVGAIAIKACINLGALPLSGGIMNVVRCFSDSIIITSTTPRVAVFSKAYGAVSIMDYAEPFPRRGGTTQPGDIIALDTIVRRSGMSELTIILSEWLVFTRMNTQCSLVEIYRAQRFFPWMIQLSISIFGISRWPCAGGVIGKVKPVDLIVPSKVPGIVSAVEDGEIVSPDIVVEYAVEGDVLYLCSVAFVCE